jgi:hypothetical protein
MAGTPPSPVKKLSALQAFKAGYIRKIKPPAPVAPALNGYGYYVPGQQSI